MPATKKNGFTLVELVIGIIVFSIAMTYFVSFIVPQAVRSVDPIFQVRAAELGQSLMTEIASKSFDENSDRVGGGTLCDTTSCTSVVNLGPEIGENRASYNDVDDYNGFAMPYDSDSDGDSEFTNALENEIILDGVNLYAGFNATVSVMYDKNMDGTDTTVGNTKRITVIVTTPNDEQITFSTFRSNF